MTWLISLLLGAGLIFGGNAIWNSIGRDQTYTGPQNITAFVETDDNVEANLKELNIELDLPKGYNSAKEKLVTAIETAVLKLHENDCPINTDDIRVALEKYTIKDIICSLFSAITGAGYSFSSNQVIVKQWWYYKILPKSFLEGTLAHELMHKYSYQNLGYLPIWLNEGFSTQFNELDQFDITGQEALPKVDLERNFSYIKNYPENSTETVAFYSFNQKFIRLWLKKNNTTLGKLIETLKPLVRNRSLKEKNIILRNYLMEHGGREILEECGFKIPEYWSTERITTEKDYQEKKPKKIVKCSEDKKIIKEKRLEKALEMIEKKKAKNKFKKLLYKKN